MTCNLFMHSYFLWMIYDLDGHAEGEGTIASVHLTSDFEKENAIYQFEIAELLRVFRSVAEDELAVFKLGRNPSTGEWKIEEK
ncbi:MAG: hypothetical protein CVT75_11480 [Alphaproteobacteria bacterium HGW-Alphaproteobacteria-14]|nr:MAG: hypothetical protein CVT75_11480 [Alphaproteobacteria bacterium HGW-Alphaproteobacteria-14]